MVLLIMAYRGNSAGKSTFFRLQVYERVGIVLVEVYEREGKSVILVCERAQGLTAEFYGYIKSGKRCCSLTCNQCYIYY